MLAPSSWRGMPFPRGSLAEFIDTIWWPRVTAPGSCTFSTQTGYRSIVDKHISRFYWHQLDSLRLEVLQPWINELTLRCAPRRRLSLPRPDRQADPSGSHHQGDARALRQGQGAPDPLPRPTCCMQIEPPSCWRAGDYDHGNPRALQRADEPTVPRSKEGRRDGIPLETGRRLTG